MKIVFNPAATDDDLSVEPHTDGRLAALTAIHLWSSPDRLLQYAVARHGYSSGNSYSGVTYPSDLDAFDLTTREPIPAGYLEVTAGLADTKQADYLIPESEYLELLTQYFLALERPDLAQHAAKLIGAAPKTAG